MTDTITLGFNWLTNWPKKHCVSHSHYLTHSTESLWSKTKWWRSAIWCTLLSLSVSDLTNQLLNSPWTMWSQCVRPLLMTYSLHLTNEFLPMTIFIAVPAFIIRWRSSSTSSLYRWLSIFDRLTSGFDLELLSI
jgi:hypothetical protein